MAPSLPATVKDRVRLSSENLHNLTTSRSAPSSPDSHRRRSTSGDSRAAGCRPPPQAAALPSTGPPPRRAAQQGRCAPATGRPPSTAADTHAAAAAHKTMRQHANARLPLPRRLLRQDRRRTTGRAQIRLPFTWIRPSPRESSHRPWPPAEQKERRGRNGGNREGRREGMSGMAPPPPTSLLARLPMGKVSDLCICVPVSSLILLTICLGKYNSAIKFVLKA
ncbi:hypothetical protein C2845_PM09G17160 [Panicum miliaceum]|uniref:Uncharacterized protein n=1 Tax=Panicum miliaceum TaxID=4540 RepID=A0A3L6RXT4_PANMI|nr:hypothetical protein C2845_PM09G17160 [Panicum miliaceum]